MSVRIIPLHHEGATAQASSSARLQLIGTLILLRAYYLAETKLMVRKSARTLAVLLLVLTTYIQGQAIPVRTEDSSTASALSNRVPQFELTDATTSTTALNRGDQ